MQHSCNVSQSARRQQGLRQHAARPAASAACGQPACCHLQTSTFSSAAAITSAAFVSRLPPQRQCRLVRQMTTAAVSPLPHYAALPLDKATHLRWVNDASCICRTELALCVHEPSSAQAVIEMLQSCPTCPFTQSRCKYGPGACRGQPEALRELFNRPDARLVVFRGQEGLVAPAEQPSPAAADPAAAATTPDSQATWQQPELK